MNFLRRRGRAGQAGLESIILYGGVIVVLAVGLVVVWQSGILRPFLGLKGYVGFSQVVPEDWSVGVDNVAYMSLKNTGSAPVNIHALGVDVRVGRVQCEPSPLEAEAVQPGGGAILTFICPGPPPINDEYEVGDYYEADVTINYTNLVSNRFHQSVGKLYGLMEVADLPIPTTVTTMTGTTLPCGCFECECNKSGEIDEENCEKIRYGQSCDYCPERLDLDGKRKCWYRGKCGDNCNINKDCVDRNANYGHLNVCRDCVDGKCRESSHPWYPSCGQCDSEDAGTLYSPKCDGEECPYCQREWVQLSELPGESEGYYSYSCTTGDDCGDSCLNFGDDVYEECQVRCVHCSETPGGEPTCSQGSCGERCSVTDDPTCNRGCLWCNLTTYKCELGDCGRPCVIGDDACQLGCDTCWDGRCVDTEVGVTIDAHNGTGGDVVAENTTIHLDVRGECDDGIHRILVSNSIPLPRGFDGITSCRDVANDRNRLGAIEDPYGDPQTAEWMNTWNITWNDTYSCGGVSPCANVWETNESEINVYCYFALAQKQTLFGGGRWSMIASDYIQVGDIDVYLAFPPPF